MKNVFPDVPDIKNIKSGQIFMTVNGQIDIASCDSHFNCEEDEWIVYGKDGESYFENDFLPDITTVLNLSVQHLTDATRKDIKTWCKTYVSDEGSFIVDVTDDKNRESEMPSDLYRIICFAKATHYSFIMFSKNGKTIECLRKEKTDV